MSRKFIWKQKYSQRFVDNTGNIAIIIALPVKKEYFINLIISSVPTLYKIKLDINI